MVLVAIEVNWVVVILVLWVEMVAMVGLLLYCGYVGSREIIGAALGCKCVW